MLNLLVISFYVVAAILYLFLFIFFLYTIYAMIVAAPFLPTDKKNVKKMIELANLKPGENLIDLGSGDGRILLEAAKTGADCVGIELNPFLYFWSKMKVKLSSHKNIKIIRKDLWATPLYQVDVLMIFFIAFRMGKLKDKIKQEMKPGTRIISYGFRFPDWPIAQKNDKVYLYIV